MAWLIVLVAIFLTSVTPVAFASEGCTNETIRVEQAAFLLAQGTPAPQQLPDCRAYELVSLPTQPSPSYELYYNGFPPAEETRVGRFNEAPFDIPEAEYEISTALEGEAALFSSRQPNSEGDGGRANLSHRTPSGWTGENIIPTRSRHGFTCNAAYSAGFSPNLEDVVINIGSSENGQFAADACSHAEPPLVPGEAEGSANLFLRETSTRSFQLINVTPSGTISYDPKFDAISADGSHVVFQSRAHLTSNAPNSETKDNSVTSEHCTSDFGDYYVWSADAVHLLTVLPGGMSVRGTLAGAHPAFCGELGWESAGFTHAVSEHGERVLFYAGGGFQHPGPYPTEEVRPDAPYIGGGLYLRTHPGAEQSALNGSGECTEPEEACTVQIDLPQGIGGSGGNGQFQWANAETSKIFFTDEQKLTEHSTAEEGKPDLYEYDLEKPAGQRLTDLTVNASEPADVLGVSGASEDGSYVYFVAQGNLTGAQQNSHGDAALNGSAMGAGTLTGAVNATGTVTLGSEHVTNVSVNEGEFYVGQEILGEGIPLGTTVTACSPTCSAPSELTISQSALSQGTIIGDTLTGLGSTEITGLSTSAGTFHAGMAINGTGIPPHTWITAVGADTLTLSRGVNTNGAQALAATAANLYVRHTGVTTFIATVSAVGGDQCDWTAICLTFRVSRNGRFIAFDSLYSLTGYDNRPVHRESCRHLTEIPGSPCMEVFRYAVESGPHGEMSCASCSPSGTPPTSEFGWAVIKQAQRSTTGTNIEAGMSLDHPVSDSGQVFFETMEKLVPADQNATWDVYEYQGGEGPSARLHLISSGNSEQPSYFEGASADGSNVFFVTFQALLRTDTRTDYDLYDARVDGGFPEPPPPAPCESEGCKNATGGVLVFSVPSSVSFQGMGNVHETRCGKGLLRRSGKCVRQKHKKPRKHQRKHRRHHRHHHRAARHRRRAGK